MQHGILKVEMVKKLNSLMNLKKIMHRYWLSLKPRRKGKMNMKIDGGHLMIRSGVNKDSRPKGGLGCTIKSVVVKYIIGCECILERVLKIELKVEHQEKLSILVLYGPNEDDTVSNKDNFWKEVSEAVDDLKGKLMVLGDLNIEWVRNTRSGDVRKHGEPARNSNRLRIIDCCIQNNLMVMNGFTNTRSSTSIQEK